MSFKEDLYNHLQLDAEISSEIADRIYPDIAPQTAQMPYLVYSKTGSDTVQHLVGVDDIAPERMQFEIWSNSAIQCETISRYLRIFLDGFRGIMNGQTEVRGTFLDSIIDGIQTPIDGSDRAEHRTILNFVMWWRRIISLDTLLLESGFHLLTQQGGLLLLD